jgi:hypothetical protein
MVNLYKTNIGSTSQVQRYKKKWKALTFKEDLTMEKDTRYLYTKRILITIKALL